MSWVTVNWISTVEGQRLYAELFQEALSKLLELFQMLLKKPIK
jgi:hypothetical protein